MQEYTKEQVEDLIDRVNNKLLEDIVYVEILGLEYHFGNASEYEDNQVVRLYSDISDETNDWFYLCKVTVNFPGYKASLETDILMTPELLEKLVF